MQTHQWGVPWGGWWGGGLLNTLLIELDGLREAKGRIWRLKKIILRPFGRKPSWRRPRVLVIGSTNIPEVLDPALIRPGRLSRLVEISPPTLDGLKDIAEYYLNKIRHDATLTPEVVALDSVGQTPAKVEEAINVACEIAHESGSDLVNYKHWRNAISEISLGTRQPVPWNPRDRERLAFHEAGHATAVYRFLPECKLRLCSIIRYGKALGHISYTPLEEQWVYSEDELRRRLAVALAGRAAEELFLGQKMASMVGDMNFVFQITDVFARQGFLTHFPKPDGSYSDDLQREIEELVRKVLVFVKGLLSENAPLIRRLAKELMVREEILGE